MKIIIKVNGKQVAESNLPIRIAFWGLHLPKEPFTIQVLGYCSKCKELVRSYTAVDKGIHDPENICNTWEVQARICKCKSE